MALTTHQAPSPAVLDIIHDGKTPVGKAIGDVDGFYYFLPGSNNNGLFSAHTLREIADLLDSLNALHEQRLNEYLPAYPQRLTGWSRTTGCRFKVTQVSGKLGEKAALNLFGERM